MSDKPILFSAPMVRALLAGTKTQTRRAMNPQPLQWKAMVIDVLPPMQDEEDGRWGQIETVWSGPLVPGMCEPDHEVWHPLKGVRIGVGDRLYVREHWRCDTAYDNTAPRDLSDHVALWYGADGSTVGDGISGRFRQGMHMPRWASRITLHVTEVRVQRLQDISEEDARAEGAKLHVAANELSHGGWTHDDWYVFKTAKLSYANLWNAINGPGSWEANPWVAAYTFTVVLGQIDSLPRADGYAYTPLGREAVR